MERREMEKEILDKPIVLIEDDAEIASIIKEYLLREGYCVIWEKSGDSGLVAFREKQPLLVIVDLMLPGLDGYDVCREIRTFSDVPLIVVSAKHSDLDKIQCLGLGADDYVTKPFSPLELMARVNSHLRRYKRYQQRATHNDILRFEDLVIDQSSHTVFVDQQSVALTSIEFNLLIHMAKHPGRVYSKEHLYQKVWEQGDYEDHRTVTVHIKNLRHKLKDGKRYPRFIETVWGVGYKFIGQKMKIRNWLYSLLIVVMILPFLLTVIFFVYLSSWYDEQQNKELLGTYLRMKEISSFIDQEISIDDEEQMDDLISTFLLDDESIAIYLSDFNVLYASDENEFFTYGSLPRSTLRGLYELDRTISHYTYKEPIWDEEQIVGYFEIRKERHELVQKIQHTFLLTLLFFIFSVLLTLIMTHFLVRRKILHPVSLLLSHMKRLAKGDNDSLSVNPHNKDEISELLQGFTEMNNHLKLAKKREQEEQQARQRLIAAISHDLRTPLTSIQAYAEGIRDHHENRQKYLTVILEKSRYMKKLIDDLLLFSTLEATDYELQRVNVDAEELAELLLDGYCEKVNATSYAHHLTFSTTISIAPCLVMVDVDRLVQVMDNLVANAIAHSPSDSTIKLAATNKRDMIPSSIIYKENNLYFLVCDEGAGIPEREQSFIFTDFYQVDRTRQKRNNSGVGLGLSICKHIVEKHGGTIGVLSSEAKGSTFYFTIPMTTSSDKYSEK